MLRFEHILLEDKNLHMEHVEDLMFHHGVAGTRKAINFLQDLRDMLAGHTKTAMSRTVKWDGAPAVFAGIDPRDGKFFVAKKGVFNKDPKVYKTPADVKADTSGDLQHKLLIALREFSKLGITKGIYQGDLMFTKGDVRTETIDGEKYYTFQPNTIVYAVPVNSKLGKTIAAAQVGVVWHTTYSGESLETMSASFGKGIVEHLNHVQSVWQDDATYHDMSGAATFTAAETKHVTEILSQAGKVFQTVTGPLLDEFANNEDLRIRTMTYNNSHIRAGTSPNPAASVKGLLNYIHNYYGKEIEAKKSEKAKELWKEKRNAVMKIFTRHPSKEFENMYHLMSLLVQAKQAIINKMNQAGSMGTFLRTSNGFKATAQEGFVAIDHLTNSAVKIVDRMEFSRANFSADIIKGWQR